MVRSVKVRWARKLMKAKYFAAVTDTGSVVYLLGADPRNFKDEAALISQSVTIQQFITKLQALKRDHDDALEELFGVKKPVAKVGVKKAAGRPKKVNVRKG